MSNVTLYGFPRSTFVKVCGLILTARNVDYQFHDTEDEMYLPVHLERHPFGRVPALQHDDFALTPEGKELLPQFPSVVAWDNRMDALPSVVAFNAKLPPRAPIPHAREWVHHHRPAA